ncbi:MAG: hypothetical protein ACP6IS_08525 [Candidatus Asgardarchaeia archaeon]
MEKKAIETYKDVLDKIDNPKVKLVIEEIYKDELRHHELLQQVYKMIIKSETLTEDDLWNLFWKDTTFRGTLADNLSN